MAFTSTKLIRNIEGNKIVEYWDVTADANSGTIQTGLSVVEALGGYTPVSCTTSIQHFKPNIAADGTSASNGVIFASSCLSGDHFVVVAVGH